MKGLSYYLFLILFLAAFSSCKKDKPIADPLQGNSDVSACGVKDPVNNLAWLKKEILEARKGGTDKYLIVTMAEYNGETYFNSQLAYSSCWVCNIVDCGGNRPDLQHLTKQQREELMAALSWPVGTVVWGTAY